ncbi:uncharacterized protein LOC119333681 [Triticum dicoccoides]|uniref:uncharacterized protein LOC119333681 n=1 Tax=Triticum dicoccoides TaxID=85692 RepID=UPI0018910EA7|nr:uncharacterized protein LOC119333681 [Triticum dicoccoides]
MAAVEQPSPRRSRLHRLAAPPIKVVAGELLAYCTTASPAGRPISSPRFTTLTAGACCRCLSPRVSRQHSTRRRTFTMCVLCCPRTPALCLRQRPEGTSAADAPVFLSHVSMLLQLLSSFHRLCLNDRCHCKL